MALTLIPEILDAVRREVRTQLARERSVRWATVATTNPLTVRFPGTATPAPVAMSKRYAAATRVVGASVVLVKVGSQWVAVDELA